VHDWLARQLDDHKPGGGIAALDGVRALAFLLVFAFHLNHADVWNYTGSNPFVGAFLLVGNTGVTLFFVLSGFLLFLPYTQALLFEKAWPRAKIYYMRRVLRIFPGYFFSLFILVMFTAPSFIQPQHLLQLVPFLTFTMGFYNSSGLINGPYWTLAVEFQFYLLLPLLAYGMLRLTRLVRPQRRLLVVVGALCTLVGWGLLTAWVGSYVTAHPTQTFLVPRGLLNVVLFVIYGDRSKFLEDFALGMLIAVLYVVVMRSSRKDEYMYLVRRLLALLLPACLALYVYAAMPGYRWAFVPRVFQVCPWLIEFGFALCYGYLVMAALFAHSQSWFVRLCSWTPLRWLGLISYSLYIWHRPLIEVLAANLKSTLRALSPVLMVSAFWALSLTVCVVFCFVLFVCIERPGMRLSERLRQRMLLQEARKSGASAEMDAHAVNTMDAVAR
jgi:peptidoglycan/LPS O-acetylase OafA/YrhL